jgi:hypothetical protein
MSLRDQSRLTALLREATGIDDVIPVQPPHRQASAAVAVILNNAKSTQRISLEALAGNLELYTWPAELKTQAKALYQTGRAQRLIDFLAEQPSEAWDARPRPHLAFWHASSKQRLYLHCDLRITEYIQRWMGDDFDHIGRHRRGCVREELWPWLREHQYAAPEDNADLDAFLERLGNREAYLRPTIELKRLWPHASALDKDGALVSEVRAEVAEVLTALDEPLPPACTA